MLRRLSPYLMVLLAVIVDTAILPVFYYGTYTVSLTLAVVLCASLVLGRLKGMLLGMIGGLLIDITAGTLGMMTFFDLAVGFLIGFVLNESGPTARRPFGAWFHLRHAAAFFACQLAGELVFGVLSLFPDRVGGLWRGSPCAGALRDLRRGGHAAVSRPAQALCGQKASAGAGDLSQNPGGETLLKPYRTRVLTMALVVLVAFGAIFARMNYMVRANGESYSATASDKSTKTIALYGMRGTVYDSNMVPLAYSRISYDVTFYRNPSRSSAADRQAYTQVLYEVIRLIESNGKTTVNDFWMKKDDSGKWVFNSGATSETVEATRKKQWKSNFSLSSTPENQWFKALCEKYYIDSNWDEDMQIKVLALWQESRMNAFNSTPCTIAYDVGFETVSEIEVRSMELDGVDISESSSRVYPQGTTACHVIGYIQQDSPPPSWRITKIRAIPTTRMWARTASRPRWRISCRPTFSIVRDSAMVEVNTRGKVVRELSYDRSRRTATAWC